MPINVCLALGDGVVFEMLKLFGDPVIAHSD